MKDIRLNVNFWDHWKTISLKDQLGLEACESLQRLWCFAAINKPSGHLNGLSPKAIEMAARWLGAPGAFVETLIRLQFVEKIDSGYVLHDWNDHQAFVAGFQQRSNQAKAAITKRWATECHTDGNTDGNTPSPLLSSPIHTKAKKRNIAMSSSFDDFWCAYPKKVARVDAVRAFNKLNPDAELLSTLLKALEQSKDTDQWKRGIIPNPATWLNGRRWEDEIKKAKGVNNDRSPSRYTRPEELLPGDEIQDALG